MAFSGPGDQQGGCDREHRKEVVKIPKDKLTISPVRALDSPTGRCSAHPHSQGVGVSEIRALGLLGGGSHMYGK